MKKDKSEIAIPHGLAIRKVQWAIQEAYKISVHNLAITDWSQVSPERKRQVEIDQLRIAKLILRELNIEENKVKK
jgi:hypothetical protein